ncbi:hypothetical protein KXD40_009129 [Peronospora effusa]|uniref:Calcium uniporter protein n=1 Tax=Peronospora effusa TaxID=542832 RepID=A0A3M6VDP1_9STRA|nr:hypothetical protein DD238_007298 [Peronospora effusa]RQM13411.1 hypothetical protein DD237_007553 [Peronospora effusa]UIZ25316.1 hypothetical protein KXD40_009129 [Peronospora effusa]
MTYREQEIQWLNDDIVRAHQWRIIDMERFLRREKMQSEHLVCEARAEQLSTVSEQSTLLRCEKEQVTAYKFMLFGVAFFFLYLGAVSWVQFYMSTATSLSISSLSFVGFLIWQLRIASKWRYLLAPPSPASGRTGSGSSARSALSQSYLSAPRTPLGLRKTILETGAGISASPSSFTKAITPSRK